MNSTDRLRANKGSKCTLSWWEAVRTCLSPSRFNRWITGARLKSFDIYLSHLRGTRYGNRSVLLASTVFFLGE